MYVYTLRGIVSRTPGMKKKDLRKKKIRHFLARRVPETPDMILTLPIAGATGVSKITETPR